MAKAPTPHTVISVHVHLKGLYTDHELSVWLAVSGFFFFTYSFLEDIFREGEIGGHCEFNSKLHHEHGDHKSPLQSW